MTAKEYLQQPLRMRRRIEALKKDIARLEAVATNCSPSLTGMPRSSGISSRVEAVASKIVDKSREMSNLLESCENVEKDIVLLLSDMENEEYKELLERRYCQQEEWQDIACEMHYAESYLYRMHRKALAMVESLLGSEDR